MIQTDFLIIGQGIAGTLLSFELTSAGKNVIVIDKANPYKSSLVAGAVLNPMAGKHWSPSPQANTFLPKAIETYQKLESLLGLKILHETEMMVFHESEEKRHHFQKQARHFPAYFREPALVDSSIFSAEFGCGVIKGLYRVDALLLLEHWQQHLTTIGAFINADFEWNGLQLSDDGIEYQNIKAKSIVFCTGAAATVQPFFLQLPFTQNRGEALIVDIPGLPSNRIYHKQLRLVPKQDGQFWCGSNYNWTFENLLPDEVWREQAEEEIKQWLRIPVEIKDHIVAKRPTTAGQIAFIGIHPRHNRVAIFNGLGTRGFSAGPYLAKEMTKMLLDSEYQNTDYNRQWFESWF